MSSIAATNPKCYKKYITSTTYHTQEENKEIESDYHKHIDNNECDNEDRIVHQFRLSFFNIIKENINADATFDLDKVEKLLFELIISTEIINYINKLEKFIKTMLEIDFDDFNEYYYAMINTILSEDNFSKFKKVIKVINKKIKINYLII